MKKKISPSNTLKAQKDRRERLNLQGLCCECGRFRDAQGKTCNSCLKKKRFNVKNRRLLKQSLGLCWVCSNGVAIKSGQQCEVCMLKNRCAIVLGSRKLWIEAKGKWESQKGKCPYSGKSISLEDTEIDHIMPRSRGGSNSIDNIQFVPPIINRMKSDQTEEEFLRMVETVYNYRIKGERCSD